MPLGTNVFMTIFPPEKRGMAMGTMGIAMILAPAIGPTLSGYIIENYDWHTMFFGMFIVGIISLALAFVWFGIYQKTTNPKADIPVSFLVQLVSGHCYTALVKQVTMAGRQQNCHYVYNRNQLYGGVCRSRNDNESANVEF